MFRKQFPHSYEDIISVDNLLEAWQEFLRGKRKKRDVQEFGTCLMDNILDLHHDLSQRKYRHGGYTAFKISDPKPRDIHKANVRDRLLHHALYRKLYPFFDRTFIADSYSCRKGKGAHKAMDRFRSFVGKVSLNHRRTCWILKCDIRKFFVSVDQQILIELLGQYIPDTRVLGLVSEVVHSFPSHIALAYAVAQARDICKGLPLGNLTSQLLVNVYMNELDQFVKHSLKVKYYIRYADDFVIFSHDRNRLIQICRYIGIFLHEKLELELHPDKVSIGAIASGVDFLGWVHFPDHRVLRSSTKQRALHACKGKEIDDSVTQSYLGLLSHGNAHNLSKMLNA